METSNQELAKRLKYTKDLISSMMSSNAQFINKGGDNSTDQKVLKQSSQINEEMVWFIMVVFIENGVYSLFRQIY